MIAKKIHCGTKLVEIYKRSNENKRAEHKEKPKVFSAEIIFDLANCQCFLKTLSNMKMPDINYNRKSKHSIMQKLFIILFLC